MQIVSVVLRIEGKPALIFPAIKNLAEISPNKTAKELFEEQHQN